MMLKALKYMHDRIAAASVGWVAVGMVFSGILAMAGMIEWNQRSGFCLECHVNRGPYKNIDLESTAHAPYQNGEKGCLDCHSDKNFYHFARETAVAAGNHFERTTNRVELAGFKVRDVPDEKCIGCHNQILPVAEGDRLELTPGLAQIGIRFSHEKHFALKEFSALNQARLDELYAKAGRTDDEQDELEFLVKVQLGNCAQCHERNQIINPETGERKLTREINFFTRNPIQCSGCHVDAVTADHPGPPLAPPLELPGESTCRRCHNGRLHGRLVTFPVQCDSTEPPYTDHCSQCHPDWKPGIHKEVKTQPEAQFAKQ